MRLKHIFLPFLFFVLITFTNSLAQESKFQIGINGTSSLHGWTAEVLQCKCEVEAVSDENGIQSISKVKFEIPVEQIEGARGATMTAKIHTAFKSEEFPNIMFEFNSYEMQDQQIKVDGTLNMAGVALPMMLMFDQEKTDEGWVIKAQKKLKMTDWGMEPPTALFGQIVTNDEVTLTFEITL